MQPSAAMQQSCARGPRQLFLYSEQGEGEKGGEREKEGDGGGDHNSNAIFPSNGAELYLWTKAIVFFM